jgi:predicted enzyme related to lactoylglutathione lyase
VITGIHTLIYTPAPDEVRAFFRDVLGFGSVDAGHGWLIFALPPTELGVHPTGDGTLAPGGIELYLMCENLDATVAQLATKGVSLARSITDAGFGRVTAIALPGGGELGLYEPRHPTAITLRA